MKCFIISRGSCMTTMSTMRCLNGLTMLNTLNLKRNKTHLHISKNRTVPSTISIGLHRLPIGGVYGRGTHKTQPQIGAAGYRRESGNLTNAHKHPKIVLNDPK